MIALILNRHELVKTSEGKLLLQLRVLSDDEPNEPVLLVAKDRGAAYLRRAPEDLYEIVSINPYIIREALRDKALTVQELEGENVVHAYTPEGGTYPEERYRLQIYFGDKTWH